MIPKDGGNIFKGDLFLSGTTGKYQADNLTADLVNRGLKAGDSMDSIHDVNAGLGGPVMRNRLWFFSSFRHWGVNQNVVNSFYNLDPTFNTYQPDPSRQVIDDNRIKSGVARLTWQAHEKFKMASYLDRIIKLRGHENNVVNGGSQGPRTEETFGQRLPKIYYMYQAKITGTPTSRLLLEKFKMRRGDWQVQADLFNSLNSNVVIQQNQSFGASLDQPTQILQGRLLTLGAQLHF
jgi:hypothetical protein